MYSRILPEKAVACLRHLPSPLIAARAEVFNPLSFLDLNRTARFALYGILTFVSLRKPSKAIWPKRDTLRAEALLQSDPTLYRGLKTLETYGYITREQERNERNGRFRYSPITLTQKALLLLGLTKVIHNKPSTTVIDGHIKKELTKNQQSLQNTTVEPDASPKTAINRKSGLPADLVFMLSIGVGKAAVCKLMKTARLAGKRLSDIVASTRHRIEHLRGNEIYAYLQAMIRKPVDYAWLANDRAQQSASDEMQRALKAKLESLDSRYDGFEVVNREGDVVGIFEATGSPGAIHIIRTTCGSRPVNLQFVKELGEGIVTLRRQTTW